MAFLILIIGLLISWELAFLLFLIYWISGIFKQRKRGGPLDILMGLGILVWILK